MSKVISPQSHLEHQTKKITGFSLLINAALSLTQIIVGVLAYSSALLADGLHTLSDLVADSTLLWVNRKSYQAADAEHPYGHARFENAALFIFGLVLCGIGLGILVNALQKLLGPGGDLNIHIAALWVAVASLLAKEGLFRYIKKAAHTLSSPLITINASHARADAATSFITIFGIAGSLMGYARWDAIAALLVGIFISFTGVRMVWKGFCDLTDHALPTLKIQAIQKMLLAVPGILAIHNMRSRQMGAFAMIDVHIEVNPRISVSEAHVIASSAEQLIKNTYPLDDILIHMEPYQENENNITHLPQRCDIDKVLEKYLPNYGIKNWDYLIHYVNQACEIVITLPQKPNRLDLLKIELMKNWTLPPCIEFVFKDPSSMLKKQVIK